MDRGKRSRVYLLRCSFAKRWQKKLQGGGKKSRLIYKKGHEIFYRIFVIFSVPMLIFILRRRAKFSHFFKGLE